MPGEVEYAEGAPGLRHAVLRLGVEYGDLRDHLEFADGIPPLGVARGLADAQSTLRRSAIAVPAPRRCRELASGSLRISSASRTSARSTAIRAAFADGFSTPQPVPRSGSPFRWPDEGGAVVGAKTRERAFVSFDRLDADDGFER